MNKVSVVYDKNEGVLNVLSRSDEGRLKVLNYRDEFILLENSDYKLSDFIVVAEFLAKTWKEKMELEHDVVDEVLNISGDYLDAIRFKVLEEESVSVDIYGTITNNFEIMVRQDARKLLCELMNKDESKTDITIDGDFFSLSISND